MKRLLYITNLIDPRAVGGREQLSRLMRDALLDIHGVDIEVVELDKNAAMSSTSSSDRLLGRIDGANVKSIATIVDTVKRAEIPLVFINGSNLGLVASGIRKACPGTRVATFFHNCETRFFLGALRQRPSIRGLAILVANYLAERKAVQSSDIRICLGKRDSRQLQAYFGRGGTHLLPMALHDLMPTPRPVRAPEPAEKYALFVGGSFYANRQGIEWFVDKVAARAPIKTYVIGRGLEAWRTDLERNGQVQVIGGVDSLAAWYIGAQVVIAPIFDGSGMKTKVAEALMFGKRIIGTTEAFVGYEDVIPAAGTVCDEPDEFVSALEAERSRASDPVDFRLRALYEQKYSYPAARSRLARILNEAGGL